MYLSKQQSTQTGCYIIAASSPFEPLDKCMTFQDIFPGLSRSWNFQKKMQDFPEGVETLNLKPVLFLYLTVYSVSQKKTLRFSDIFSQTVGNF